MLYTKQIKIDAKEQNEKFRKAPNPLCSHTVELPPLTGNHRKGNCTNKLLSAEVRRADSSLHVITVKYIIITSELGRQ